MKQTAVEFLEERINTMWTPNAKELIEQAKEMEKQEKQKTIEEVFEWLTKNNYVTDLKETLIEQFKNR